MRAGSGGPTDKVHCHPQSPAQISWTAASAVRTGISQPARCRWSVIARSAGDEAIQACLPAPDCLARVVLHLGEMAQDEDGGRPTADLSTLTATGSQGGANVRSSPVVDGINVVDLDQRSRRGSGAISTRRCMRENASACLSLWVGCRDRSSGVVLGARGLLAERNLSDLLLARYEGGRVFGAPRADQRQGGHVPVPEAIDL